MSNKKRRLLTLFGCVQGVGFRPFVFRLAKEHCLVGTICNTTRGVSIDVQGESEAIDKFERDLVEKKPEKASISELQRLDAPLGEAAFFAIAPSEEGSKPELALLPDTAICKECLEELFDPNNRRYRYPFLHCMSCGPRFSLFERMPFDRKNTTMADFPLCLECQSETQNPSDRRFYSQTTCCPACGPKLELLDGEKKPLSSQPIVKAAKLLLEGKILAVKNTGGFLLLADAANDEAVLRLRRLKKRPKKPFALLARDLQEAGELAEISPEAKRLLTSPAAPIVLLKKKGSLPPSVAGGSPYYGLMLPHTALQILLLAEVGRPLIATSGNLAGEPLCIDEKNAFGRLPADAFLVHNRRIVHRLDDSVVQVIHNSPMLIRRARGYTPFAMDIPSARSLFGAGGHQKNSFAMSSNGKIYPSQHIGDLDGQESRLAYEEEVESWKALLQIEPSCKISDLHPGYYTTRHGVKRMQHHRAHVYSGMLDNRLSPPFFAVSWDGTGLGDDGTIWGGEAFLAKEDGLIRFAALAPFCLPGSESAVREPRRSLLGMLHAIFGSALEPLDAFTLEEFRILCKAIDRKLNAPLTSSMGRLFDGISALLGCCTVSQYEGEAALALEALACSISSSRVSYDLTLQEMKENFWRIEWKDLVKQMIEDKARGAGLADMAFAFHRALVELIVELANRAAFKKVLLTGGCMQNKLLLEMAIIRLRESGFEPYWHREVPPNDGGLGVGQLFGALFI